jgi:multidrug resistance efflux pump
VAEDQLAALDKQIASLNEQIRQVDENVAKTQAKAGGLNQEQWGMARERILGYLAAVGSKSSDAVPAPHGFTDDELAAMEKHLEQLRGAQSSGCL